MLSSKQTQKTQRDMAPDSVGFFSKMRKSLSGKHYHRNNGGFDHGMQARSKSMTIPQMDRDTAITYMKGSSIDKARRSSYSSSAAANVERVKAGLVAGLSDVPNGSMHMNGKMMNGTHTAMDENANDAAKRDSHADPQRPKVSIFEKQGARPKVRKTSTADDSNKTLDKNASEGKIGMEEEKCLAGSSSEPPCVEMAQPHFPAVEINHKSCSASRRVSSESSSRPCPGGGKAAKKVPLQEPTPAGDPSEPAIARGSQSSVLSNSDPVLSISQAPTMTENPGCRTETPKPNPSANTPLKSDENDEDINPSFSEPEQVNVERPIPTKLASSCSSCPTCDEAKVCQASGIAALSASCVSPGESLSTDLKHGKLADVGQKEMLMEHDMLLTSTDGLGQRSPPNANQTESFPISESASESINKLYPLDEESKTGSSKNINGDLNSEGGSDIGQIMRETILDLVRAAVVESTSKATGEKQSCKTGSSRHCCTCTCIKPLVHPAPPSSKPNNAAKATLTLEDIPQDIPSSCGDSPKPPRTPHIAVLVNSDELFLDEDRKTKSLPEQDLRMMQKLNEFSRHQVNTQKKCGFKKPSETHYSETSEVVGPVNASQESTNTVQEETPHFERHEDIFEDPAIVWGATGGSDDYLRSKAPLVDRSSKPKELCEAAKGATAEEPPPLPPRLPAAKKPDPFANYPIFDDEDDDFPTHEFLHEINMDIYTDPKTAVKSKSLPRDTTPSQRASSPELRAAKRGKTVNMRNRFSQMFKPGNKKKRHSTHGFPDRPLPDIPLNPRLHRNNDGTRRTNSVLFGTATGDIVSQQAVREGLLKETPSKEEVDRAREQFAVSLRRISEYGWYWGPMSWDDAESRLENMPDGSFLVRDSSDDRHLLSLSFRAQGSTHHTRVEHHNGKFSFWSQPCSHGSTSIVEFVEEAMRHSHSGRVLYFLRPRMPGYPPAAVQLLYPISRFQKSRSLQHMCRFVIRKHVRLDHIDSLPLPRRLKDYLNEAQYYTQDDILH